MKRKRSRYKQRTDWAKRLAKRSRRVKRAPEWRRLSFRHTLFDRIDTVLRSRGTVLDGDTRVSLRQRARAQASPGFPARDVLQQMCRRLEKGALLSQL